MKKEEIEWLLNLAKKAIESEFSKEELKVEKIPAKFRKKRACFVTLTEEGKLRGCVGHLEAVQALYLDVIENAKAAAFEDPRFDPVEKEELDLIKMEISILGEIKKYEYKNWQEIIDFLKRNKKGVLLEKNGFRATFLPQVWEELTDPEEFLNYLCRKAGLGEDEWKRGVEISFYEVEIIRC